MHRTAGNYHCSIRVSVLCMGVLWRWRCVSPRGVGVPGWDSCVRVSVVCLDVLCVVIFRLGASCFLPVVFACCASPSQWVRAWAVGRANPLFGMFIVNTSLYFMTYKVLSCLRNNFVLSQLNYYCRSTTSELLIHSTYWTGYFNRIHNYFHCHCILLYIHVWWINIYIHTYIRCPKLTGCWCVGVVYGNGCCMIV